MWERGRSGHETDNQRAQAILTWRYWKDGMCVLLK